MPTPKGGKAWNSGTGKGWTDRRGYRWVYVTSNGKRRARKEHRVVFEQHLGRELEPWELVHHKDENKSNNDLSNLELTTFGQHATEHNTGSRKSWETRRTLEAFGLMRETLKSERLLKAELLEALQSIDLTFYAQYGSPSQIESIEAAIAKATGAA